MNQSERIEQVIRSSFDLLEYGSDYHNSNHLKVFQLLLIKNNQSVFLKTFMDRGASSSSDSSGAALVPCKARYVPGIKGKNPRLLDPRRCWPSMAISLL